MCLLVFVGESEAQVIPSMQAGMAQSGIASCGRFVQTADMDTHEIEWRSSTLRSTVRLSAAGTNGVANVRAEWLLTQATIPHAPHSVTVRRVRQSRHDTERGVTTAVLRDAEPLLTQMTSELPKQLAHLNFDDPMQELSERARALPPTPRGNPDFYKDLLAVFQAMESAGVTDPVKTLCRLTGRPEGTVKTQLRIARRNAGQPSPVDLEGPK